MSITRKAVFLDRDGVLNDVVWRNGKPASPRDVSELVIAPGARDAADALRAAGYLLFAVTNQPDVRRELMSQASLDAIHAELGRVIPLDEIIACVHDDRDGCLCRKPRPGMLLDLASRWNIDLSRSWMIGDQDRDMACARAAGVGAVLLARDYNSRSGADIVGKTIAGTAQTILARDKARA